MRNTRKDQQQGMLEVGGSGIDDLAGAAVLLVRFDLEIQHLNNH